MTDDQVQQVITALQNESLLDNWPVYGIMFAVSLIGAWFGAFIKSYSSEKGKYSAIEDSLETIQKQIKVTTETSEKIKTALDHDNWRKKELETFKRQKLEEYGSLILQIEPTLSDACLSKNSTKKLQHGIPELLKAQLIQALYLPELSENHDEFCKITYTCIDQIENNFHCDSSLSKQDSLIQFENLLEPIHSPRKILLDDIRDFAKNLNNNNNKADS